MIFASNNKGKIQGLVVIPQVLKKLKNTRFCPEKSLLFADLRV